MLKLYAAGYYTLTERTTIFHKSPKEMLLYKERNITRGKLSENKPVTQLKILGIAGSPRRDGNTDHLLQQVIAGASSQGAETKTVILSELNISPCRHCDGCIKTGKCVVDDDMQWLHTRFKRG